MVILVTGLTGDPSPDGGAAPRAREMRAMRPLSPCRWEPRSVGLDGRP